METKEINHGMGLITWQSIMFLLLVLLIYFVYKIYKKLK
ncbi:F0F1-type ATP synthase membrane subunit b/b' [Chryseobacterium sp. SLBN-27]|nr:F0F1-type ATP synthase membrane subunit b/b' [Chryseobacterium sp. SLBN-27]